MAAAQAAPQPNGYKKLGFVEDVAERGVDVAGTAYATAKKYVPQSVRPRLDLVEEQVTSIAAPYVAKAQDAGSTLLKTVDARVRAGRGCCVAHGA